MPRKHNFSPILLTVPMIAALFDVTDKTVRAWIRDGLPAVQGGGKGKGNGAKVDVFALLPWYFENACLDLDQQRARLAKEQADRTALENAARRGELVDVAGVEREWTDHIAAVRSRLLAIPTSVGSQLDAEVAPRVAEIVRVLIHAALEQLSHYAENEPASRPSVDASR